MSPQSRTARRAPGWSVLAWYTWRFAPLPGGSPVPLYEYECTKCHRRTEKIEPMNGPHLKKCPYCGGKVEQAITAPAIQFKGSGWYVTDYAGKNPAKEAGASEKGDGEKGEKKEASKESTTKESKDSGDKKAAKK